MIIPNLVHWITTLLLGITAGAGAVGTVDVLPAHAPTVPAPVSTPAPAPTPTHELHRVAPPAAGHAAQPQLEATRVHGPQYPCRVGCQHVPALPALPDQ